MDGLARALVVASNLAALVPTLAFFRRGHQLGAVSAALSGVVSTQWHACNVGMVGWCGPFAPQEVGFLDYVFANALGVAAVAALLDSTYAPASPGHLWWVGLRDAALPATSGAILIASVIRPRGIWLIVGTIVACVSLVGVVFPGKVRDDPCLTRRWTRLWWAWALALVSLVAALALREAGSTRTHHYLAHSLWHVVVYLVAAAAAGVATIRPPGAFLAPPTHDRGRRQGSAQPPLRDSYAADHRWGQEGRPRARTQSPPRASSTLPSVWHTDANATINIRTAMNTHVDTHIPMHTSGDKIMSWDEQAAARAREEAEARARERAMYMPWGLRPALPAGKRNDTWNLRV